MIAPRPEHCKRGHLRTEKNTYWRPAASKSFGRECRTCKSLRSTARKLRAKQAGGGE